MVQENGYFKYFFKYVEPNPISMQTNNMYSSKWVSKFCKMHGMGIIAACSLMDRQAQESPIRW